MTKFLANFINLLIQFLTFLLPRWKRLTVRARLYDRLQPFETINVGGKELNLFIPDRTCVYWAKEGPESEPTTNAWINSFEKGDTFLDIGANIGLYSMMAALKGITKVYAIEPNPFSFAVLSRNIVSNGLDTSIVPFCLAMSEKSSMVTFKLGGLHAGSIHNFISADESHPDGISISTAAFSLDELIHAQGISRVNHLKIDVDGLEIKILQGATELLSASTLKSVLVEDNSDKKSEDSDLVILMEKFDFIQTNNWGTDTTDNRIFIRT